MRFGKGDAHPFWKGDGASRRAVHLWLARHSPKTGVCEDCGAEGQTDYALKDHSERHSRDRAKYAELCRACHYVRDHEYRVATGRAAALRQWAVA